MGKVYCKKHESYRCGCEGIPLAEIAANNMYGILNKEVEPLEGNINKPSYYNWIPGIECKEVTRHFNYNKGCAIKYIWRAGRKANEIEDLKKAINYLQDEIKRVEEDK